VGGAGSSTHDDGEDVNFSAMPVAAESIGQRGVFVADKLRRVRGVGFYALLPFTDLNLS
jgi:hypothetical protein